MSAGGGEQTDMSDTGTIEGAQGGADPATAVEGAVPMASRPFDPADVHGGYNLVSVILHGLTGLVLVLLAVTGLSPQWSGLHASAGLVLAPLVALLAMRRFLRGYPRVADEAMAISATDRLVMALLLACIILLALTGAGLSGLDAIAPAPGAEPGGLTGWIARSSLGSWTSALHRVTATGLLVLAALHVLLALRHALAHRRRYLIRIVRPVAGGR